MDIMRTFVRLRELLATPADLARRLSELEERCDQQFLVVFKAIRQILSRPYGSRRRIGFDVRETRSPYVPLAPGGSAQSPDPDE